MNPLDFIPKPVLAVLAAVLMATSCKLKIDNNGLSLEVEKHATRIAELREGIASAQANASAQRAAMETKAREAAQAAIVREKSLAADRARAVSELDGLRVAVSQAQRGFGLRADGSTLAPSLDATIALGDVLLESSERYTELAETCDRHASDVKTLIDSWPRVSPISQPASGDSKPAPTN
jgi:hypothetical protein